MNTKTTSQNPMVLAYSQKWVKSIADAIEATRGTPVTITELSAEESENLFAANSVSGLWMRFFAGKSGEQAFLIPQADAVHLAQTVAVAPPQPQAALAAENRDALMGFFQQLATTLPVPGIGAEPEFSGYERPSWPVAALATFSLSDAQGPVCILHDLMSEDFVSALAPASDTRPAPASSAPIQDSNLEILMDVELEVTLRFGQKQMLLRDVLNVGPGSVLELDQQVHEPVELVVGRKVVAWGEVVAVDGNYGLRITSIASQRERLESLA
ncbi:MAG: FliM/FliN family flagellar motor switch protein, partial [Terriglobia bacterium]